MHILVTGGAGFIGARLSRSLRLLGHSITVLDNLSEQVHRGAPPPDLNGARLLQGDVRDPTAVATALDGVDAVYHLAAETAVGQSQYELGRYVSVNVHGTAVVLEACVAARTKRLVLASSRAVYGEGCHRCAPCGLDYHAEPRSVSQLDAGVWSILCPLCGTPSAPLAMAEGDPSGPVSVYGLTKLQQEQLVTAVARRTTLAVSVLRLFNVFGPGQSLGNPYTGVIGTFFHRANSRERIELYEDGEMLRDFVFVDDAVEALGACLTTPSREGQVFNIASGRRVTLREVAVAVCRALDVAPSISCRGRFRVGDVRHAFGDPSLAKDRLGFSARTSFESGLDAYISWARRQPSDRNESSAASALMERGLLRSSR